MRVTTSMVNESAKKAGLLTNQSTLLDYINKDDDDNSLSSLFASSSSSKVSTNISSVNKKTYETIASEADNLTDILEKLSGSENGLLAALSEEDDDSTKKNTILELIEDYVDSYNSLTKSLSKSTSSLDAFYASSLGEATEDSDGKLKEIGITLGTDGKLSIDTNKLKNSSVSALKAVFGSDAAYQSKAALIAEHASSNANSSLSSISSTYSQSGSLLSSFNSSKYDYLG